MTAGKLEALERELRGIGAGYSGKWTCSLSELNSGGHIAIDEDDVMPTASLIKVPVLVSLYQAVQDGRLRLDERVTYGQEHRTLGSGVLLLMSPGVEMTLRDAAMLMIIVSDNSATNMCVDFVGIDAINATMRSLGLSATTLFRRLGDRGAGLDARKMSVSTAGEIVRLMTLIARHEAVSADASEDMLRILRRCQGRAELSNLLPWTEMNMLPDHETSWVAEKGGAFINGIRTGGSIFTSPRGTFVMSVFCEGGLLGGTNKDCEGNVLLGRLGKAAWDALSG